MDKQHMRKVLDEQERVERVSSRRAYFENLLTEYARAHSTAHIKYVNAWTAKENSPEDIAYREAHEYEQSLRSQLVALYEATLR